MYFLLPLNVVKYMILIQYGKGFIKPIFGSTCFQLGIDIKAHLMYTFFYVRYQKISSKYLDIEKKGKP